MFGGQGSGGAGGGGAGGIAGGAEAAAAEPVKEKEAFDIKISAAVDAKSKIKVIKEVRAITGLGLKEVTMNGYHQFLLNYILVND